RFLDKREYRRSTLSSPGREKWPPVRPGIQTNSRNSNELTMEPDAIDHWSERRSYDLSRATQMDQYADTPHQNGWIYSPELNGLTYLPQSPTTSAYGYT